MSTLKITTGSQVHPESALPSHPSASGVKFDSAKPRYSLLPAGAVRQVVDVLEFGARKYAPDNWKHVPDARTRYYDAAVRHLEDWWVGRTLDPETGKSHLAHAAACLMFLMWFDAESASVRSVIHSDAETTTRCGESVHKCDHRWTWNPATGDAFCGTCMAPKGPPARECPKSPNGTHHRALNPNNGDGYCIHCLCNL